ncbi:MAG TPA: saccharopine dehydrogenase, partial [Actinomycetes bacterium]|nr:saccharopine dehydrogenase [Actinomycetes bacterium]
ATRVAVGYFTTGGGGFSSGTLASGAGLLLEPGFAWRGGRLRRERTARRLRTFRIGERDWLGVSYGGSEHYALPRVAPGLRRVEVYLGWFGRRSRAVQAASAVASPLARLPGARALARAAVGPLGRRTGQGPDEAARARARTLVVAEASDQRGRPLARVQLRGPDPYTLTARLLAWGALRAASHGLAATGALGPVDAFGLDALQAGAAEAGLERFAP